MAEAPTVWDWEYRVSKRRRLMALAKVQEIVSSNPVVIFSERYESYRVCVKQLFFLKLGAPYKAIDLDDESKYQQTTLLLSNVKELYNASCMCVSQLRPKSDGVLDSINDMVGSKESLRWRKSLTRWFVGA
ncbi:hypothetical protein ABKV19_021977 [Rosa sericea]